MWEEKVRVVCVMYTMLIFLLLLAPNVFLFPSSQWQSGYICVRWHIWCLEPLTHTQVVQTSFCWLVAILLLMWSHSLMVELTSKLTHSMYHCHAALHTPGVNLLLGQVWASPSLNMRTASACEIIVGICMYICIIWPVFVAPCFPRPVYTLKCSVYWRAHVCDLQLHILVEWTARMNRVCAYLLSAVKIIDEGR